MGIAKISMLSKEPCAWLSFTSNTELNMSKYQSVGQKDGDLSTGSNYLTTVFYLTVYPTKLISMFNVNLIVGGCDGGKYFARH